MRGGNTAGGFNHRRHDLAKRQLQEFKGYRTAGPVDDLRGGGFIVTFRYGETVQVVFVWADSVAQARHKALKHCTLDKFEEVVARPTGLTWAYRPVGLVKHN